MCPVANLPAFETSAAAYDFLEANSPGATVIEKWICTACGQVHVWAVAVCPAGASSGTTRTAKHIDEVRARFWKLPVALTVPRSPTTS